MTVLARRSVRVVYRYRGRRIEKVVEEVAIDAGDMVIIVRPVLCIESCYDECYDNDLYDSFEECVDECVDLQCASPDEEVGEEEEYMSKEEFFERWRKWLGGNA